MTIPTKIFIVPFRNREQYKHHFDIYMKYVLEDVPSDDYKIYFVHQQDKKPFNRGAMKNIGFLAMKKLYPEHYKNITFIFNDIDTVPYKKNLLNYDTRAGTVKHFYGFTFALGGIFSINGGDFEKISGFPNYWEWGLEDNCIQDRAKKNGIQIDRSNFYPIFNHNIIRMNDRPGRILSKQTAWRYNNDDDSYHHIQNLVYDIENEYIHVKNFDTKFDPNKETFYKNMNPGRIKKDARFAPMSDPYTRLRRML